MQGEEQNFSTKIRIALHKPKWNMKQPKGMALVTLSYILVVANGDLQIHEEAMASLERDRWVQAMIEEIQPLQKNQTW